MNNSNHPIQAGDSKVIYSVSPLELYQTNKRFNIAPTATLKKYRFIECNALIEKGTLKIWEYSQLPENSFTAVSHVWDGASTLPNDETFEVQGAGEQASGRTPISISIIREACYAAMKRNVNLLWIDRLCIVQSDDNDKTWHFKVMHDIYKYSVFCITLPDGLAQLPALNRETPWINRGWTLQEAVAPREVQVLFAWDRDEAWVKPHLQAQVRHYVTPITKGRSAMAPLGLLLDSCISGSLILMGDQADSIVGKVDDVCIFGVSPKGDEHSYKNASPSIAMLAAAISRVLDKDEERIHHCLWKCMLMRATRYRSDLIFSVMGLFGVTLDAANFPKNDCVRPAIALAQELLKRKKPATWLGASYFAPPCPQLSTFPSFPRFTEGSTQKALIRDTPGFVAASSLMVNEFVDTDIDLPVGDMDDQGYFTFTRMSVPVTLTTVDETKGQDKGRYMWGAGQVWRIEDSKTDQQCQTFAVFLGVFCTYSPVPQLEEKLIRVFIIKRNDSDTNKFYVLTYAMLTRAAIHWFRAWAVRTFSVGGPDTLDKTYDDEPLVEVVAPPKVFVVPDDSYNIDAIVAPQHRAKTRAPLLDAVPIVARRRPVADTWVGPAKHPETKALPTSESNGLPNAGKIQAWGPSQSRLSSEPTFTGKTGWKFGKEDAWTTSTLNDVKLQLFGSGSR